MNKEILKSNYIVNNKKNYFNMKYPFSFPNNFSIISLTDYQEERENEECFVKIEDPYDKIKTFNMYNKKLTHHSFDEEKFKLIKL